MTTGSGLGQCLADLASRCRRWPWGRTLGSYIQTVLSDQGRRTVLIYILHSAYSFKGMGQRDARAYHTFLATPGDGFGEPFFFFANAGEGFGVSVTVLPRSTFPRDRLLFSLAPFLSGNLTSDPRLAVEYETGLAPFLPDIVGCSGAVRMHPRATPALVRAASAAALCDLATG